MITHGKCVKIFTGNSNPELAKEIAKKLNVPLGICEVSKFSNGEISVDINETVRGADVFVIQSTCDPVNDNLMELLILLDAFKRASAGRITAVIPHYGYARQDRKAKARQPITAKLVADLIHTAGADRVLTMDLHAAQIQGFFNIPVDHLLGLPLLAEYFSSLKFNEDEVVAVSPDIGGVSRARQFAEMLHIPMAIIDKRRPRPNVSEVMNIIGNVEGKKAILVDDIIDTAGSICNAADALINVGAKEVYACCTHPVFSGPAIERLSASKIKKIIVLNTIPLREEAKIDKIKVISVATLFADAIRRIYNEESISVLFKRQMKK